MAHGPEAALLQYQASMGPQHMPQYEPVQQSLAAYQQAQNGVPLSGLPQPYQDSPYLQQDMAYAQHIRAGSVSVNNGLDVHDDKRRKGSAVTATNDKELREMLAKNEGRPLREVAVEVIQKERTPMAEKTKQLFAMLWWVHLAVVRILSC